MNAIPTVLLLIFLNRRIRAVGPLVLLFMIVGVIGATFTTSLVGDHPNLLKAVGELSYSIGLSATGTIIGLHLIGFAVLAIVGWLMLELLRRLYESKRISEQSITIDAMWLLFGIVNSIGLVFEGYRWFASGFVAFTIYKIVSGGVVWSLRHVAAGKGEWLPIIIAACLRTRQAQRAALRHPR